jgi:hypothetical protein
MNETEDDRLRAAVGASIDRRQGHPSRVHESGGSPIGTPLPAYRMGGQN